MSMGKKSISSRFWKVALATAAALCLMLALAGCGQQSSSGEAATDADITVTLVVDGTEGDKGTIFDGQIGLDEGATAYDALLASGLELEVDDSASAPYITGIGGLTNAAGDPDGSGWLYEVNGEMAGVGAESMVLSDGDTITWTWYLDAMKAFANSDLVQGS